MHETTRGFPRRPSLHRCRIEKDYRDRYLGFEGGLPRSVPRGAEGDEGPRDRPKRPRRGSRNPVPTHRRPGRPPLASPPGIKRVRFPTVVLTEASTTRKPTTAFRVRHRFVGCPIVHVPTARVRIHLRESNCQNGKCPPERRA